MTQSRRPVLAVEFDFWLSPGPVKSGGFAGADILTGGLGRDILLGGSERDLFDLNNIKETKRGAPNRDQILDFQPGTNITGDDIDLRTIDAKTGVGATAFKFIGAQHFHHVKGELHYVKSGGHVSCKAT